MGDALSIFINWVSGHFLGDAVHLVPSIVCFGFLSLIIHGRAAIGAARSGWKEIRLNLDYHFIGVFLVGPVIIVPVAVLMALAWSVSPFDQSAVPIPVAVLLAVFASDFVGYWRHRFEHTALFWPAHAIHHADTAMTWTSLERFHFLNRATTAWIDIPAMALLGFSAPVISVAILIRHFYGQFEHMDLAWDYGRMGKIFTSPRAHRWHHAVVESIPSGGCNFAVIFSFIDILFGTYHCPKEKPVTGVSDQIPDGWGRQFLYPFSVWIQRWRPATPVNPQGSEVS